MLRKFLFLAALLPAGTALAASAVAYTDTGIYGYAYNHPNASRALQAAVSHCARRSADCTRVASTSAEAGYSAVASGSGAFGHALAESDARTAIDKAMAMCKQQANDCQLEFLWREKPVQPMPPIPTHP